MRRGNVGGKGHVVLRRLALLVSWVALVGACTGGEAIDSPGSRPTPATSGSIVDASQSASPSPQPSPVASLGDFPAFPHRALPDTVAASLQAVLDGAVEGGTFHGLTAAVIVGDSGSWSGAAGADDKEHPLTPDSQQLIASVGKTVTAAAILRLAEEGMLNLDHPAVNYLPKEAKFFDANGATVRDVLGMRSGLSDPGDYGALVDSGSTPAELLRKIPKPLWAAGSGINYANMNYILLGMIIEHVTGRPLWDTLHSDVLSRPGLDGLTYRRKDAMAADGWQIESDPASLARWGYDLYGRSVLSDASLRQMTDFQGDWYGLGAIDFSHGTPAIGAFGIPAVGHGGMEPSVTVVLVAFPQTDVVVAVQTNVGSLNQVADVAEALNETAQS
jgi:D-alanyl-D-alanine carboxypeptidase